MTVGTDGLTLRLIARHAQLVRALREADLKLVARAGSRARLADLQLLPKERAAAQSARAIIGHALREARLRAKQPQGIVESSPAVVAPHRKPRGRVAVVARRIALERTRDQTHTRHTPTSARVDDPASDAREGRGQRWDRRRRRARSRCRCSDTWSAARSDAGSCAGANATRAARSAAGARGTHGSGCRLALGRRGRLWRRRWLGARRGSDGVQV